MSHSESTEIQSLTRPVRPRQTRGNNESQHHQVKWYVPSAITIYDDLFNIEKRMLEKSGTMYNYVATHLLACRIYYAVLFHIRILLARQGANLATNDEKEVIKRFDEVFHIDTLPIHSELVENFRDVTPYQIQSHDTCAIAPTEQEFIFYEFSDHGHGKVLTTCEIPASHAAQPSPKLGLHLLRWYIWNINQPDDDSLPDITQRLAFITLGTDQFNANVRYNSDTARRKTLQHLFSNPIFKHPLPTPGGLNIELLNKLRHCDPPPRIHASTRSTSRSQELLTELLVQNGITWFNQVKYVVSHLCTLSEGFSFFSEVNLPYYSEELEYALKFIEEQGTPDADSGYPSFGIWMSIFSSSADYQIPNPE